MEKPIHDHEQDDDSQQPRGCLKVERGNASREAVEDADSNKPGNYRRNEGYTCPQHDWLPMSLLFANHARGNRYQD